MAKSTAERVKTARIRRKAHQGIPLSDDEAAHLDDYEASAPPAQTRGRSASARKVDLHIEEAAEAEGDHLHPEAYAAMVRSEGLRADTLLNIVTSKLIACNDQYMKLMMYMMERSVKLEEAHIGLLDAVREQVLARVDAEAQARALAQATSGEDGSMGELLQLLQLAAEAKKNQKSERKSRKKDEKPLGSVD
jgi:hypothetical protein